MLMKVYGGTDTQEGESLCDTCRHSHIIRGRRLEEEIVLCGAGFMQQIRVTFKVVSCSDYVDGREPDYHELLEKAWILFPGSKRRAAGFIRATDLTGDDALALFRRPPRECVGSDLVSCTFVRCR